MSINILLHLYLWQPICLKILASTSIYGKSTFLNLFPPPVSMTIQPVSQYSPPTLCITTQPVSQKSPPPLSMAFQPLSELCRLPLSMTNQSVSQYNPHLNLLQINMSPNILLHLCLWQVNLSLYTILLLYV